jgi:hypothetical protein
MPEGIMDATRFDTWTRRRFGLATGSLLAAALGLGVAESVGAKHKKKHCKQSETKCGKKCVKGTCCPDKPCGAPGTDCACERTVEGKTFCAEQHIAILCAQCSGSGDCDSGEGCVADTQCTGLTQRCQPGCPATP